MRQSLQGFLSNARKLGNFASVFFECGECEDGYLYEVRINVYVAYQHRTVPGGVNPRGDS